MTQFQLILVFQDIVTIYYILLHDQQCTVLNLFYHHQSEYGLERFIKGKLGYN